MECNAKLLRYIATRDKRVAKVDAIGCSTRMSELFAELQEKKRIQVGGRSSCGGKVDPTWVALTSWNEVVRKANELGYRIQTLPIKQKNAYATIAGGFWHENEYVLESA